MPIRLNHSQYQMHHTNSNMKKNKQLFSQTSQTLPGRQKLVVMEQFVAARFTNSPHFDCFIFQLL